VKTDVFPSNPFMPSLMSPLKCSNGSKVIEGMQSFEIMKFFMRF
jgi:hypothetical protein